MSAWPLVGSVMRERILSNVLLPAPLRPMMPTTSPLSTSNETSRSAQNGVHRLARWRAARKARWTPRDARRAASHAAFGSDSDAAETVELAESLDTDG